MPYVSPRAFWAAPFALLLTLLCMSALAAPAGASDGRALGVGYDHTCVVKSDDTPVCWGYNYYGQSTIPNDLGTVTQLTASDYNTCAIKTDGSPFCWGNNEWGQSTIPDDIGTVTQLTSGSAHICAIKSDGTPICWGNNDNGQSTIPDDIGTVTEIIAGALHTCAIKSDGTPICWGANADGQSTIPDDLGTVVKLSAGAYYTCAIKSDRTPACWGDNYAGQATIPDDLGTVTQLSVGHYHTCVIKTDGVLACWGYNVFGATNVPDDIGNVLEVSAGEYHTCVVKSNGFPFCWGNNYQQQSSVPAGTDSLWRERLAPTTTDDVPAAWRAAPVTVTLSATDTGGSGVNETTYEIIDAAGDPGTTHTYDAAGKPILANGQAIRYRSTDEAGNTEADHTSSAAKVDTAAPTTTDDVPTTWQAAPVAVTLTATDTDGSGVDETTYEIIDAAGDPGATESYDAADKPALGNGEAIRYRSTDEVGNTEADHTSAEAKIETAAPTTTDDVPAAWQAAAVTVTLTATDTGDSGVDETSYEIIDAAGQPGGTHTYDAADKPILANGQAIRYRSTDEAGNTEADHTSSAAKVDTAAPSTTDDVPSSEQAGPVTVTLTATDTGSGVDETTYEIISAAGDPGATQSYDASAKPTLAAGEKIRYRSIDEVGNAEVDHTSAAVKFTPAPTPTPSPDPTSTPAPSVAPAPQEPQLRLLTNGYERQLILHKKALILALRCGAAPCRVKVTGALYAKGKKVTTLKPFSTELARWERRDVEVPTTKAQRGKLADKLGAKSTKGEARLALVVTSTNGENLTVPVIIGLKRPDKKR